MKILSLEKIVLGVLLAAGLFGATLLLNPDNSGENAEQLFPRKEAPSMVYTID